MPNKRVILVAGYDYESKGKGIDFFEMCKIRAEQLINEDPKSEVKFILFDVGKGQVMVNKPDEKGRRKWKVNKAFEFKRIDFDQNYTVKEKRKIFNKNQDGIMSITDVYNYVQRLGHSKINSKSIIELSIFSHGWDGGPILVNSDESPDYEKKKERDPKDKDARKRKDFNAENLKDPVAFKKAFDANARIWVWGCIHIKTYNITFSKLLKIRSKDPKLKKVPFQKLQDKDEFLFEFDQEEAKECYEDDSEFFPQEKDKDGNYTKLSFKRKFREIKEFFMRRLNSTYFKAIAKASGVKCYGGFPGTYADIELPKVVRYPLMVIPKGKASKIKQDEKEQPVDFTNFIKFYLTYLGMTEDPEHRGYGVYVP
jgi:hypothetical protein